MKTYRNIQAARRPARLARVRRALGRVLSIALLTGAVSGAWVKLTTAESLSIRNIAVEGTGPERADEIRALLGVRPGDNLLFADLSLARARAESHPWVVGAAVKRELPDTLRVVVQERQPKLILALDRLYYVDATGEPFKALAPGDIYDMPVLTGLSREDLLQRAQVARSAIAGALELAEGLSGDGSALPLAAVSEIVWDEDEGYAATAVHGGRVRFGHGDFAEKLARLRAVRAVSGGNGVWGAAGEGGAGSPTGRWRADATDIDLTYSSRVIVAR